MQVISHNIAAWRKYFWDCKSHFFAGAPSFLKTMTYHSNDITGQDRMDCFGLPPAGWTQFETHNIEASINRKFGTE